MIPIKTSDIISDGHGKRYVVKNVVLTKDGPIIEAQEITAKASIFHAAEINVVNESERLYRTKSIGSVLQKRQVTIPKNMTREYAQEVLRIAAKRGMVSRRH